jgi:hypothetical protein
LVGIAEIGSRKAAKKPNRGKGNSVGESMMKRNNLPLFTEAGLVVWMCGLFTFVEGDVKVKVQTIDYHGWKDAVEISDGESRLVVVPSIGRILVYGFADGENVLWENPECRGKTLPPGGPAEENGALIWIITQSAKQVDNTISN